MMQVVCRLAMTIDDFPALQAAWKRSGEPKFEEFVRRTLLAYGREEIGPTIPPSRTK